MPVFFRIENPDLNRLTDGGGTLPAAPNVARRNPTKKKVPTEGNKTVEVQVS